jgi:hypothetical protein
MVIIYAWVGAAAGAFIGHDVLGVHGWKSLVFSAVGALILGGGEVSESRGRLRGRAATAREAAEGPRRTGG